MNKKFVTLLSVAVLSTVTSGVYADEITLGGNTSTPKDNSGLVVSDKPSETPADASAPKADGNLDLGGSSEKPQEKDNTGVVVEPTTPSADKGKEEKPAENVGDEKEGNKNPSDSSSDKSKEEDNKAKEDSPEVKEQKQKAEDNVGVKEKDTPKPLNVTKEEIKEKPIETNTGYKVVSTNKGKVVVETPEGKFEEKEPYEVGAVKQQDGTIALKDKEGELKVLPNTGTASTFFTVVWGVIGLIATVWGRIKIK